jgi:hypothetical protein
MDSKVLEWVALGLAVTAFSAGLAGMLLGFLYLSAAKMEDVIAGAAGFLGGALLVSSGTIAVALVTRSRK